MHPGPHPAGLHPAELLTAAISWRPAEDDLVLLAAVADDVPVVAAVLATLPGGARGQVFLEATGPGDVRPIEAPGRMCVTWLRRDLGQDVRTAVGAWLEEMLPADHDREHRVYAWCSGDPAARALTSAS